MSMSACYLLLVIMVGFTSIHKTEACSCIFATPDQKYCSSDLVLSITVKEIEVIDSQHFVYPIDIVRVNRNENKVKRADLPTRAETMGDPFNSCSLTLIPGRFYVAAGTIQDGTNRFRIDACDYLQILETEKDLKAYKFPKCSKKTNDISPP